MKKSTKVILITAVIFLCFGIVFTAIGGVTSAGRYSFRDIVENGSFNMSNVTSGDFDDREYTLVESFEAEDIDNINITLEVSALKIRMSEDDKCRFYADEESENMISAQLDEGTLEIWDDDGRSFFKLFDKFRGIYSILELPEKEYKNLEAYVDCGCIYGDNIKISNECNLYADMGNITLNGISCKSIYLNCDMGNIDAKNVEASSMEADCDMGNIDVRSIDSGNTVLNCDMGNITASFTGNSYMYKITKDCDMGSVGVSKSSKPEEDIKCDRYIEADCDMGNIDIMFEE